MFSAIGHIRTAFAGWDSNPLAQEVSLHKRPLALAIILGLCFLPPVSIYWGYHAALSPIPLSLFGLSGLILWPVLYAVLFLLMMPPNSIQSTSR